MRFRVIATVALLAASLLTAGCNGSRELDEIAYVLTIGVDAAEGDQLVLTFEIGIPRVLASEGGKVDPKKGVNFVTVTAPTLAEGRNLLNSAIARAPNFSHVTTFIIGEDYARKGVDEFLGPAKRFREFRGSIDMVVVNGKAKDFMLQNTPEEVLASRWFNAMLSTGEETGYYLRTTLHEFYVRLKSGSGSPYATLMGINPLSGEGRASGPTVPGDRTREYLPKDMPRESGNPAGVIGTAVFKEDKLVGMLPSEETRMLAMLLGYYPQGFVVVDDPLLPSKPVSADIRLGRDPKINIDIAGEHAVIHINVFLEGYTSSIPSGINYESPEYKGLLEQQISGVVRQKMLQMLQHTQEWGADVVDFGYYVRSHYTTHKEFRDLHWDRLYPSAELDVVVETVLRRNALMRKTSPVRSEEK
jgi:spore germination protein KC